MNDLYNMKEECKPKTGKKSPTSTKVEKSRKSKR